MNPVQGRVGEGETSLAGRPNRRDLFTPGLKDASESQDHRPAFRNRPWRSKPVVLARLVRGKVSQRGGNRKDREEASSDSLGVCRRGNLCPAAFPSRLRVFV